MKSHALKLPLVLTLVVGVFVIVDAYHAEAASGWYHGHHWHSAYVSNQAWANHGAQDFGANATFWGTNKTHGRNFAYPEAWSAIHYQRGITSGYSDCADNVYRQRWYEAEEKYFYDIFYDGTLNNWHTNVTRTQTFPISFNPLSSCNQATWIVVLGASPFVEPDINLHETDTHQAGGWIVCIYVHPTWDCSAAEMWNQF